MAARLSKLTQTLLRCLTTLLRRTTSTSITASRQYCPKPTRTPFNLRLPPSAIPSLWTKIMPTSFIRIQGAKRSEEHTSEFQSRGQLVCRLLLEKKKEKQLNA